MTIMSYNPFVFLKKVHNSIMILKRECHPINTRVIELENQCFDPDMKTDSGKDCQQMLTSEQKVLVGGYSYNINLLPHKLFNNCKG
jgi:hypothetical protein